MIQGRYEKKYLLTEETAVAVRKFVAAYLPPDQYMAGAGREGYHVHSLYLDSSDCELYRRSVSNEKNRYKLRIRFYDLADDCPAFLEIKRRLGDSIHKQRAMVTKQSAERLLHGQPLGAADLLAPSDLSMRALHEFGELRQRVGASGVVYVHYRREAYVAPVDNTRVTFDRFVAAEPFDSKLGFHPNGHRELLQPACVVLELKHSGHAPPWLSDLVATFDLRRTAFPKYIRCFDAIGSRHIPRAPAYARVVPVGGYPRELA